eukprot:TRINITY_DN8453_c0_g1_i4.p1 TRINITY_DN8453_c0_g1~~TRINITY_DN8453_c0_g1_i4.p1  ORF type:complete len:376 (+),score=-3.42 TRINITY_DN8453_c0_g1_i4:100-1227(+)
MDSLETKCLKAIAWQILHRKATVQQYKRQLSVVHGTRLDEMVVELSVSRRYIRMRDSMQQGRDDRFYVQSGLPPCCAYKVSGRKSAVTHRCHGLYTLSSAPPSQLDDSLFTETTMHGLEQFLQGRDAMVHVIGSDCRGQLDTLLSGFTPPHVDRRIGQRDQFVYTRHGLMGQCVEKILNQIPESDALHIGCIAWTEGKLCDLFSGLSPCQSRATPELPNLGHFPAGLKTYSVENHDNAARLIEMGLRDLYGRFVCKTEHPQHALHETEICLLMQVLPRSVPVSSKVVVRLHAAAGRRSQARPYESPGSWYNPIQMISSEVSILFPAVFPHCGRHDNSLVYRSCSFLYMLGSDGRHYDALEGRIFKVCQHPTSSTI